MKARHNTFMEKKLYSKLRQVTGLVDADARMMQDLVNYIDWASRSGIKLNFSLTEEELKCVEVSYELVSYSDLGVYPDQIYLPVFELF